MLQDHLPCGSPALICLLQRLDELIVAILWFADILASEHALKSKHAICPERVQLLAYSPAGVEVQRQVNRIRGGQLYSNYLLSDCPAKVGSLHRRKGGFEFGIYAEDLGFDHGLPHIVPDDHPFLVLLHLA